MIWRVAHSSGNPILGSENDVEFIAGWNEETGKCFQSLLRCGFIDDLGDGTYQVHDHEENAPSYVKERNKKRRQRERVNQSMSRDNPGNVPGQSPSPLPSLPLPNIGDATHPLSSDDDLGPTPNDLAELWNERARLKRMPLVTLPIKKTTKNGERRWKAANARLAEHDNLDEWRVVIDRILARSFNLGDNQRGWQATFDYLCRVATFDNYWDGSMARSGQQSPVSEYGDTSHMVPEGEEW